MQTIKLSKKTLIIGYIAGIISGMAYGLNPLFAKPLLDQNVSVTTLLFCRYIVAMIIMGIYMLIVKDSFKVNKKQLEWLFILGLLFTGSSTFLFAAYNYIPSGLATTLIYLYPVFTAIIMVFLKQYPRWPVWVAIFATVFGVILLCMPSEDFTLNWYGVFLSIMSGLSYTLYLVVINKAKALENISANTITFYALAFGSMLYILYSTRDSGEFMGGMHTFSSWLNILCLAIFPTMISMITLAMASKSIGPTKTSVLGVAEPLTAIVIGTILFNEPITKNIIIGILICIAAVLFMIIFEKSNHK